MPETGAAVQPVKETSPIKFVGPEDLFDRVQRTFDSIAYRAFEIFENRGSIFGRDLGDWLQAESELLHPVHVDIAESDEALTLHAEVPGFNAKELEISVEPSRVTITGQRETKEESETRKIIYRERCCDQILRIIELATAINPDKVTATLKDGVLELVLPKAARARKIPIETKVA